MLNSAEHSTLTFISRKKKNILGISIISEPEKKLNFLRCKTVKMCIRMGMKLAENEIFPFHKC